MYSTDMLLESKRVSYCFTSKQRKISPGDRFTSLERILYASAAKHGLRLSRVKGMSCGQCLSEVVTVYRLESADKHQLADFMFEGGGVNLLLLFVKQEFQGNFWSLRRFIKSFTGVVFEVGATKVFGVASPVDCYGVRQKRDWRSLPSKRGEGTKLLNLYARLGFSVSPTTNNIRLDAPALTYEAS